MTEQVILAFSSCPDEATARYIATVLVTEGLVACANRLSSMQSTYVWDGRLQEETEVLLIMKTIAATLPALTARLKQLHPYDLPEVVAIPVTGGNEPYLDWVRGCAINKDQHQ